MTCQEFREAYHRLLDQRQYTITEPAMLEHLAACPSCTRFKKNIAFIDLALRQSAEIERKKKVKLSPELKRKLRAIPAQNKEKFAPDEFWKDVERMIVYAAGAIAVVIGAEYCSPAAKTLLHMGVLTVGLTKFTLVSLRRLFLN